MWYNDNNFNIMCGDDTVIEKIIIKNFKSIQALTVKCNNKFNIIIGENNIGKTTIFEAIHLWRICYEANIQKRDKCRFYSSPKNINFSDNEFLRVFEDKDLINNSLYGNNKDIEIIICLGFNNTTYELGFKITKVKGLDNAYLQIDYIDKNQFSNFSSAVSVTEYNLATALVVCESRPIANIVAKEPYMYKAQIADKLSRGKGHEVLRNKIIKSVQTKEAIESHISSVMGKDYKFTEVDKDNKTYIRLMVNGTNILSQGSGFLQIAEIFSSLEYSDSAMSVVLIDEPDSHLHMSLQKKLIDELRRIDKSQVFIISHNENFINYIPDEEIIFIDEKRKSSGTVEHIEKGYKNLILKGLSGNIERIEELRNASHIVLLEGDTDISFIQTLIRKYVEFSNIEMPCVYIEKLYGIDTLNDKLLSYSRAYAELVPDDAKWIIIRDSDCLPVNMQSRSAQKSKEHITVSNKEILFQKGYGIESTFISETDNLGKLLIRYYELSESNLSSVVQIIMDLKAKFANEVLMVKSNLYKNLQEHFNRQKKKRTEYKAIDYDDMLRCINETNIEYIMTKKITDRFLNEVHTRLQEHYTLPNEPLTSSSICNYYSHSISNMNDLYDCHKEIIQKIVE